MDTFAEAVDLTDPANLKEALIVLLMFAALWTGGIALVGACSSRWWCDST
jgi:hypothetical protein